MNYYSTSSSIWDKTKRILLVITFDNLDQLLAYRTALKETGVNVNDSHVLCIVHNKNERRVLREIASVSFIHTSDFNFFGKLKDANTQKILNRQYDAMILVGDIAGRYGRLLKKINYGIGVGINSSVDALKIKLSSPMTAPAHLINFAKETMMKIDQQ